MADGEAILGWNLVQEISRRHRVCVVTQERNREGIERAIETGRFNGVEFRFLGLPFWPEFLFNNQITLHLNYYLWQIMAYFLAARLNRELPFDFCHHVTFANYWMPSFIGAYLPVSFIWGPMGGGQRIPEAFLGEYDGRTRAQETIRGVSQWIGTHLLISRKRCLRRAKAILVCNQETKDRIPARFRSKVRFFPVNGISESDLKPERAAVLPDRPFIVLTTGRLVHWKNFSAAIKAFSDFSHRCPETRFKVIGDGPEKARLQELAEKAGVPDRIQFIPWLTRDELLREIRSSHVFLYPSLREGGGAVVVEAMASGVPVIALDIAGPGFHVQDAWGIKIEPRDPDFIIHEMSAALERLYLDGVLREGMGAKARERAAEYYRWDKLGDRMERIYQASCLKDPDSL